MRDLDSVVRLHRWKLEKKSRKLAELQRCAARLRREILQLDTDLRDQQQNAARGRLLAAVLARFAEVVARRRQKLCVSLAGIETEIQKATDEVATVTREYKRLDTMRVRMGTIQAERGRRSARPLALKR